MVTYDSLLYCLRYCTSMFMILCIILFIVLYKGTNHFLSIYYAIIMHLRLLVKLHVCSYYV